MSKIVSYKTPLSNQQTEERQGHIALLPIGKRKIKFVLQYGHGLADVTCLVHYASGYRLGSLNEIKVRYMRHLGHNAKLTDRKAAQTLLNELIVKHGKDKVLAKIDAAPVLNNGEPK